MRREYSKCAVRLTETDEPAAVCVVTMVFAAFAFALPRVGLGSLTVSPFLPLTLILRTSAASTTFFLCAARISSIHSVGTKPEVDRSAEMTLSSPYAIPMSEFPLECVERELLQACRAHQTLVLERSKLLR
jgi:hypothetical protein